MKINILYVLIFIIIIAVAGGAFVLSGDTAKIKNLDTTMGTNDISTSTSSESNNVLVATSTEQSVTITSITAEPQKTLMSTKQMPINTAPKTLLSKDITSPTIPYITSGTQVSDTQINITWSTSIDNVGVIGYIIYRNDIEIGTTPSTKYAITSLLPATKYYFAVAAYDKANNVSQKSNIFTLQTQLKKVLVVANNNTTSTTTETTTPTITPNQTPITTVNSTPSSTSNQTPDLIAPSVPTNLNARAISTSQINLTWSVSTDNVGVTGYKIYRNGSLITTVSGNTYSNTGLTASTLYSFSISAFDAAGNTSPQSVTASITTQSPSSTGTTHEVNITSNGTIIPSSLVINVGDTVNFKYINPGDELIVTFSPQPPSSMKLDHERTSRSYTFISTGTWNYGVQGNLEATIIVN